MGLVLFWSRFAQFKLNEIYHYYKLKAGKKIAKKITNGIIDKTISLNKNPEMGQIEYALDDEDREFRYLVYTNYKIIYYINKRTKQVVIANVFDTRQSPEKIKQMD